MATVRFDEQLKRVVGETMVIAVAAKVVILKTDRNCRIAVRQGNGCNDDFTAVVAVPGFAGDGHKIAISELCSVAVSRTMLFSEESIIIESFVLKVTLARMIVNGMEFLADVRRQKAV